MGIDADSGRRVMSATISLAGLACSNTATADVIVRLLSEIDFYPFGAE